MNVLRLPVIRAAIRALAYASGSHGLDAGCGPGLQAVMLAEAVRPAGHVTGLDLSAEMLTSAGHAVREAGMSDRISLSQGDVRELPFADDSFDWAWSVDCVGYAPIPPLPLVKELARVVEPGGSVAILAWSSEKLLPGYPLLEARLNATVPGIAPFAEGRRPESHVLRALSWFDQAGLEQRAAQTFVGEAHAPLTRQARDALKALFEMRWPGVEAELENGDARDRHFLAEYRRLCLPESPDFIVDSTGYYAFFTYSMFRGEVAARRAGGGEVRIPQ